MSIEMRADFRHQESKVRHAGTELWLLSIAEVRRSVALSPLSLLLFSPRLVGWSRRARQDLWFRQTEMPPGYTRSALQNNNRIRELNNLLMKLRLQILHWLSLHILSANKPGQLLAIVSASWFRQQRATVFK